MEHHGFILFELIPGVTAENLHVVTGAFITLILVLGAVFYRLNLKSVEQEVIPDGKITLKNLFQSSVEAIYSLAEGTMGPEARNYFALIGTIFIFVFFSNLMGTLPGFNPITSNINTNIAIGVSVFLYYNYLGIKHQGFVNYFKHFMGGSGIPVYIGIVILLIELISHMVRPITLAVRLYVNMTADHIVLGIFSDLVKLIVPVIFMAFGIFVSFVQAFVFCLLTTVYIGMATAHEEEHH